MKKTSIYLEHELDLALASRAEAQGITKAELIRRSLRREVNGGARPKIVGAGVFEGPGDVVENMDKYMEGFGRD